MTAPESPRPSDVEAAREALALDRIVADLALTDEASEIAMLLNDHAYVPSGLRGVSRCACGVKCHGMPHEWRNHVATVLADVDHHRTDQGGALGEVERRIEERVCTSTPQGSRPTWLACLHIVREERAKGERGGEQHDRLAEAVKDVCWRATQYGQTEDGDTYAYLVTKGAMHRLIGAAQSAGIPAAFRAEGTTETPDAPRCTCDTAWSNNWTGFCPVHAPPAAPDTGGGERDDS